jgi:glycosyltransferase involved in cell wall biosynthesis
MQGRRTGVEEYTLSLLLSLFHIDKENEYVLFLNSWKEPGFDFSIFHKFPNVKIVSLKIPNKLLNFSFWYLGWPHIDKLVGGADIVFLPNIIFYGISKNARLILTIHDLSFERYPETFSFKRKMWHAFINPKRMCRRANRIIAVSNSTKNDVMSLYKIGPRKVEMIYSAVDEKFRAINRNDPGLLEVKEKYGLPYKFILYLGTIEPRKNIIAAIRAFDQWQNEAHREFKILRAKKPKRFPEPEALKYKLVIAGSKGWLNEKIYREISESAFKKHIQMVRFIEEKDKEYFLNLASLFVYPSFFEGFGFPPLEAMKCGVPVIASNNSSLPEIVGDGGILVDPDKPDEIFRAIKEITGNRELKEKLVQKGLAKSKEFDWKKTAQEFLNIISKC